MGMEQYGTILKADRMMICETWTCLCSLLESESLAILFPILTL